MPPASAVKARGAAFFHSPEKSPAAVELRTIIPTNNAQPTEEPNAPSKDGEMATPHRATLAE